MKKNLRLMVLFVALIITRPGTTQVLHTVSVLDETFSPRELTINIGDTVLWVGNSAVAHTATSGSNCSPDGKFDSGTINDEDTFIFVFTEAGTFPYYCIPHCNFGMTGEIIVEESTTGIIDLAKDMQIIRDVSLYPNPARDNSNFEFELMQSVFLSLELFDLSGRNVKSIIHQDFTTGKYNIIVPASELSSGVYFLELRSENQILSMERLVKN